MAVNNISTLLNSENVTMHTNEPLKPKGEDNSTYNIRDDTIKLNLKNEDATAEFQHKEIHIHDAIDRLNNLITMFNKRLKLSVHEKTNQLVIKIIDQKTNKVVREIPPKEFLHFVESFHKLLGVFIDKKS